MLTCVVTSRDEFVGPGKAACRGGTASWCRGRMCMSSLCVPACGTHLDEERSPSNVWHWPRCQKGVVIDLSDEG